MGDREVARVVADYWRRYLWRLFTAKLHAFQTAFRRGIRSSKNSVTATRPDSRNQFRSTAKALAAIDGTPVVAGLILTFLFTWMADCLLINRLLYLMESAEACMM